MKKILMVALLGCISYAVDAQDFINNTGCDYRFREECVDPVNCNAISLSGFTPVAAGTTVALPASTCASGLIQTFIVDQVGPCSTMYTTWLDPTGICGVTGWGFPACPPCSVVPTTVGYVGSDIEAN